MTAQRVLVTAGASGIGREIVRGFATTGAKVFVADLNEEGLAALEKESPNIMTARCDMSSRSEIERINAAVRETQDRWRTRQLDEPTDVSLRWSNAEDDLGRHHSQPA